MSNKPVLEISGLKTIGDAIRVEIAITKDHFENGLDFPLSTCCSLGPGKAFVYYASLTAAQEGLSGFHLKGSYAVVLAPVIYVFALKLCVDTGNGLESYSHTFTIQSRSMAEATKKMLKAAVGESLEDYQCEYSEERVIRMCFEEFDETATIVSVDTWRQLILDDWR